MKFWYVYEIKPDKTEQRRGGYFDKVEAQYWAARFADEFELRGIPKKKRSKFEPRYEEYSREG